MSDTPRTDRQEKQYGLGLPFSSIVGSAFARQLERELQEAIKERDAAFAMFKCECGTDEACRNLAALHSNLASVKARLDTSDAMLREEWAAHQDTKADLAEARRDAARLTWLESGGINELPYNDYGNGPEFDLSRAAIDAAMAADPPAK